MQRCSRRPVPAWRLVALLAAGMVGGIAAPEAVRGQPPVFAGGPAGGVNPVLPMPPTGPAPGVVAGHGHTHEHLGPVRRAIRHTLFTLHDRFIGYPEYFAEPPLGFTMGQHFRTMTAKANPHDFMLYRSDFLADGTALSPGGARRLTRMANCLPGWLGPIVIEATPDRPGLAEARKASLVAALNGAGVPVAPEQVVIGMSPYNGMIGDVAATYYPIVIERSAAAPLQTSLPPLPPEAVTSGASVIQGGR